MGAAFVKRRMMAELGTGWRERFAEFDLHPAAAASSARCTAPEPIPARRSPASCNIRYGISGGGGPRAA